MHDLPAIKVPFVVPHQTGAEQDRIEAALKAVRLAGDNRQMKACHQWLRTKLGVSCALLTPSGTAGLELAAILADLQPGDEVIMPSFTFSSTANAVVLRGAVPVFVDIRADTLNINENLIEAAISPRTRAVFVVHYAGVPCEMDQINAIAQRHKLLVLEDAAQALMSTYHGRPAGALGDMAAISFHETKNIHCGEGGAFLTNNEALGHRAEIIREKGTNRSAFFRGEVDKYTWVDIGSSFLANEMTAAFLEPQLERAVEITEQRLKIWDRYQSAFAPLEAAEKIRRPHVPAACGHNAHLYYLLLPDLAARSAFIQKLRLSGVQSTFHYIPLHSAPAGRRYGKAPAALPLTDDLADRLVRLPLWPEMNSDVDVVIDAVFAALEIRK